MPYTYNPWAKWVFICFLAVVYLMPVFYVFSKRNVAETSAIADLFRVGEVSGIGRLKAADSRSGATCCGAESGVLVLQ